MRMLRHHATSSSVNLLRLPSFADVLTFALFLCLHVRTTYGLSHQKNTFLRKETTDIFYHGYENYMKYAFPEDEIRPLSCAPHTRDRLNPGHFEINDALGNYSLTLIDSLSTLAILASAADREAHEKALRLFQDGIKQLVEQYGDGTDGPLGHGARARGFDLDSKVQVFETAIRGLGGLLSAHLFAVGELPIHGYEPDLEASKSAQFWQRDETLGQRNLSGIVWQNGFVYDGQLLRLAYNLGERLVPAFWTSTGIPYPRVNLRTGIPFYANSPHNLNPNEGQCLDEQPQTEETTETCSAGAGSLVLEFTVLSRLTGDGRFEELAKRAFWAIWNRRSNIDLIGAGINAETGEWIGSYTGIGAGIDSFFEYAFKQHILLQVDAHPQYQPVEPSKHPGVHFPPLTDEQNSAALFHQVWESAHTAIKRHLLRASNHQHPHYVQADMYTGAGRAFWIDSLSAYYPGVLTLSGHVEEAIASHLLVTALWTRFAALPERYNIVTGGIEGGLGWWPGRPEFIESNYYLYRATGDPWYKHVAEMVIQDIKRRCWARCGWTGLQNVLTGEKADRMESFFLGETAKYLFLTFDDDHPINRLDKPFVFSTEGHPLIIPASVGHFRKTTGADGQFVPHLAVCPAQQSPLPFALSTTAARGDVYHAAALARLHQMPPDNQSTPIIGEYALDHPRLTMANELSPSNFTYFPWTLPPELIPFNAVSLPMKTQPTYEITFPTMQGTGSTIPLQKAVDGIQVNSLSGLRLTMIQDVPTTQGGIVSEVYRVQYINSFGLGKDEKVYVVRDGGFGTINPADPVFTRVRDSQMLDLVVDYKTKPGSSSSNLTDPRSGLEVSIVSEEEFPGLKTAWHSIMSQLASLVQEPQQAPMSSDHDGPTGRGGEQSMRATLPAISAAGPGAAPIPDWPEAPGFVHQDQPMRPLLWTTIYVTDELCDRKLSAKIARTHQVIIIKRGKCSFSKKLSNIPMFVPLAQSLQLVVVVNYGSEEEGLSEDELFRPLLDETQRSSGGLPRPHPIAMIMVGGGQHTYDLLQQAVGIGIKRRYTVLSQGILISNLFVV